MRSAPNSTNRSTNPRFAGAERFTGIAYREIEISSDSQRVQALSALIRGGAPVVVAVGFDQRAAVETVADRAAELPSVGGGLPGTSRRRRAKAER